MWAVHEVFSHVYEKYNLKDAIHWKQLQLWATGDWQLLHNNVPAHASCAEFFGETSNHPGDSAPIQPGFGALRLLAFPNAKITLEREEISDCRWDSGKYDNAAYGDSNKGFCRVFWAVKVSWENCVRSQVTYFEGDWGVIVLYTMFLVSCSINVSIFHIAWMDTFRTGLV